MRSDPKIIVFCDGMECNLEIEIDLRYDREMGMTIDRELTNRGWDYYGNLDFCQKCKEEKNHVVLKGRGE